MWNSEGNKNDLHDQRVKVEGVYSCSKMLMATGLMLDNKMRTTQHISFTELGKHSNKFVNFIHITLGRNLIYSTDFLLISHLCTRLAKKTMRVLGHTAEEKLLWTQLCMRMSKYIWTSMWTFFWNFPGGSPTGEGPNSIYTIPYPNKEWKWQ